MLCEKKIQDFFDMYCDEICDGNVVSCTIINSPKHYVTVPELIK